MQGGARSGEAERGRARQSEGIGRLVQLGGAGEDPVRDSLRQHPPAPFSLWRFTTAELELAGTQLPKGAPVLVDIQGVNETGAELPVDFG
ncbi:hypothetical protein [Allokutzneria sp. NRRL B-24872]|uniref:hypothetical protein n=1 Tax=Allokutzneria sp. NRRL B-24872 TaxID=1137961 RepID=UPI000A36CD57|nr:hypothetical protein [Allokutzneria sp. NRRL B-24872]